MNGTVVEIAVAPPPYEWYFLLCIPLCRVDFPFLVLLVSGGNCILAVARGVGDFLVLGKTWDDAPGEAYDKVRGLTLF